MKKTVVRDNNWCNYEKTQTFLVSWPHVDSDSSSTIKNVRIHRHENTFECTKLFRFLNSFEHVCTLLSCENQCEYHVIHRCKWPWMHKIVWMVVNALNYSCVFAKDGGFTRLFNLHMIENTINYSRLEIIVNALEYS
jgi:hypothetical protein